MTRILVVDDDAGLARALSINLRARHYDVEVADTGAQALALAARHTPDAIILDLGLPDMDGTEVIEGLSGWSTAAVIVLSARESQGEKVRALDLGAVDYIVKPFGMDELLARLRSALRRVGDGAPREAIVRATAFTLDLAAKRASRDGVDVRLTPTEWHVLEALARFPGRLVGHRELLREVWGSHAEGELQYLRVYMATLRRKLEPVPGAPVHLITEPGLGYRLELGQPSPGDHSPR